MKVTLFLLALFFATVFCGGLKLDRGNLEAVAAFDAALLELWQDGTYDDLYRSYYGKTPERFSDCVEDVASLNYPTTMTNKGLLDDMLDNGSLRMGYFEPLAILPGFDTDAYGNVVGGFYPDLAEEIVARIAINYGLPSITLEWIPILAVPDFYPDHVDGVYDVIFMSLFKTAMWSAPVAPRPDIWQFSCGLLTTEPLRYYVCPSAVTKGLNTTSSETLDTPSTIVKFIGGGAQETAANANFPSSQRSAVADLATLFDECENGPADVIVELPDRITSAVDGFILDNQPIATYQNTGAAFRLDKNQ